METNEEYLDYLRHRIKNIDLKIVDLESLRGDEMRNLIAHAFVLQKENAELKRSLSYSCSGALEDASSKLSFYSNALDTANEEIARLKRALKLIVDVEQGCGGTLNAAESLAIAIRLARSALIV